MLCQYCKNDFSDSVIPIHTAWCRDNTLDNQVAPDPELVILRETAKELGIKSSGSKKRETLEKEIAEITEQRATELTALRVKAESLSIIDVDQKDAETLLAEIALLEQE